MMEVTEFCSTKTGEEDGESGCRWEGHAGSPRTWQGPTARSPAGKRLEQIRCQRGDLGGEWARDS